MPIDETLPLMRCPRCHAAHPDYDGFGFIAHTKPAYPDGCGWCSHPSRDGDGKGGMVCGICGDVESADDACDPVIAARYARVHEMAREDVRANREPRVLTGELAEAQWLYDEETLEEMIRIAAAKESN